MAAAEAATVGLWAAVAASGIWHGLNPGMGWPLAVSAGLMGGGRRALAAAFGPLALGHVVAMAAVLVPFAVAIALAEREREIRIAAGALVTAFGVFLLFRRRHPRAMARIRPTQLALWSFAVATAHGAGLMLLPIYLGLCRAAESGGGHAAAAALMGGGLGMAAAVTLVHVAAMTAAGGAAAWAVHDWLGLKALRQGWFNLDAVWAASLALVGAVSLVLALAEGL